MEQKNKLKLNSGGLLVFILTVGVFGIINTEMGVVGILPLIATTFNVSVPQAGWTVSVFALVVAASAPVTPLLFSGINRKKVMLLALGLFTISNVISMFTSNFTVLLIARILPAFLHPVYVSMAFTVAAASVSKEQAPKAVSKVFVGVSAGMVLGVPLAATIYKVLKNQFYCQRSFVFHGDVVFHCCKRISLCCYDSVYPFHACKRKSILWCTA